MTTKVRRVPTKTQFRKMFKAAKTAQQRFRIFYRAACSGRWKKCKGNLEVGEKRCIAGLICDLDGAKVVTSAFGGENFVFVNHDGSVTSANSTPARYFARRVGFDPFKKPRKRMEPTGVSANPCLVEANDETDIPLCGLAKLAKKHYF